MRVVRRIVVLMGAVTAIGAVGAASAQALPSVLVQLRAPNHFQVRPHVIGYTGDGTGYLGGNSDDSRRSFGALTWTRWTARQATGRGQVWLNDCDPSCADGSFSSRPVRVHLFSPGGGHFRRLTLQFTTDDGTAVTDQRRLRHSGGYWSYDIVDRTEHK